MEEVQQIISTWKEEVKEQESKVNEQQRKLSQLLKEGSFCLINCLVHYWPEISSLVYLNSVLVRVANSSVCMCCKIVRWCVTSKI